MRLRFSLFISLLLFISGAVYAAASSHEEEERLRLESQRIYERSLQIAKFYELPAGQDLKEITAELLESPLISEMSKDNIRAFDRRIFLFSYPSDGLQIKGIVSFVPNPQDQPMLVVLRGGNRIFGLLNPASDLICAGQYTVLATAYRGGVSEGVDEFGGRDVNDVKQLMDYLPELEQKLHLSLQNENMFLLGGSRGGMEMFLTLGRFPELQNRFKKVVSLSGLLDMQACIAGRRDMKEMFIADFGLIENVNEELWMAERNPILTADKMRTDLPILIIQGTQDNRVGLEEGYHMVSQLQAHGCAVTYWEIEGAEHCLINIDDRVPQILQWLEAR